MFDNNNGGDEVILNLTECRNSSSRITSNLPFDSTGTFSSSSSSSSRPVLGTFVESLRGVLSPPRLLVLEENVAASLGLPLKDFERDYSWFLCPTNEQIRSHPFWSKSSSSSSSFSKGIFAQNYYSLQFGIMSGQLGDGRVVTLCETYKNGRKNSNNSNNQENTTVVSKEQDAILHKVELQRKGGGIKTPYSRGLDGLLTLRSALKEWIISKVLKQEQIPTNEVLAVFQEQGGRECSRESFSASSNSMIMESLPCGVLLRVMNGCSIRVGTFDYLSQTKQFSLMFELVQFLLRVHFPGCCHHHHHHNHHQEGEETEQEEQEQKEGEEKSIISLASEISRRSGSLVAKWQVAGFVHGNLNSDNISIVGETMDLATGCFLKYYNDEFCQNADDQDEKMYAFGKQPQRYFQNCERLSFSLFLMLVERRNSSTSRRSKKKKKSKKTAEYYYEENEEDKDDEVEQQQRFASYKKNLSSSLSQAITQSFQQSFATTLNAEICSRLGIQIVIINNNEEEVEKNNNNNEDSKIIEKIQSEIGNATLNHLRSQKPDIDVFFRAASQQIRQMKDSSSLFPNMKKKRRSRSQGGHDDDDVGGSETDEYEFEQDDEDEKHFNDQKKNNNSNNNRNTWLQVIQKHQKRIQLVLPTYRYLPSFQDLHKCLLNPTKEAQDALRSAYDSTFPQERQVETEGCGCG